MFIICIRCCTGKRKCINKFGIWDFGFVSLRVSDALGKEVALLVNEIKKPGKYKVDFDGSGLASGIYFYKLSVNGFSDTKRMILLKKG